MRASSLNWLRYDLFSGNRMFGSCFYYDDFLLGVGGIYYPTNGLRSPRLHLSAVNSLKPEIARQAVQEIIDTYVSTRYALREAVLPTPAL